MPFTQISLWLVESNFCFPHVILSIFVLVGVDFRKKYSVISLFSTTMLKKDPRVILKVLVENL